MYRSIFRSVSAHIVSQNVVWFGLVFVVVFFFPFYSKVAKVSFHFLPPPTRVCFSPWHLEPSLSHTTSYFCLVSESSLEDSRKTRVPFCVHCYFLSTEAPTWHIQGHPVNLSPWISTWMETGHSSTWRQHKPRRPGDALDEKVNNRSDPGG